MKSENDSTQQKVVIEFLMNKGQIQFHILGVSMRNWIVSKSHTARVVK